MSVDYSKAALRYGIKLQLRGYFFVYNPPKQPFSACSAVQQEFGHTLPPAPKVTLVVGADRNEVWFEGGRQVRLRIGTVTLLPKEWSDWPNITAGIAAPRRDSIQGKNSSAGCAVMRAV